MKKFVTMILSMALLCTMCIGCGKEATDNSTSGSKYANATEAFCAVTNNWTKDEDRLFPWAGGELTSEEMHNEPAALNVSAPFEESSLNFYYYMNAEQVASVTDAAALFHMMNMNSFSAVCVKLADGTDTAAFATTYAKALSDVMWMCGFPDKAYAAEADGYLFLAFGLEDFIVDLDTALKATFETVTVHYNEWI